MSISKNKTQTTSRAQQILTGTEKHFSNAGELLPFGGTTRTVAAVVQVLQTLAALRAAVLAAQATAKTKVADENDQAPALLAIVDDYVAFIRAKFGQQPDVLVDFGLAPRKVAAPLTAEQKAVAAAKRTATRQARHTMGTVQKKTVKGAIHASLVVTPAPGSPPAATPPAPTGSVPTGTTTPRVA